MPNIVLTEDYGPLERHQIDIYQPTQRTGRKAPVVLFLYGGSWTSGSRSLYSFVGRGFAARGYVVAIPDYRLFPDIRYPAFMEDAALACAWVAANISSFGGDAANVHLMGHSAGAHMGALLVTNSRFLADVGLKKSFVRSFAGLAGPYSFNPVETESTTKTFQSALAHCDGLDGARPIKNVCGDEPPMLLLHGQRDKTVGVHNTRNFANALRDAHGRATVKTYPLLGHRGLVIALAWPLHLVAPVFGDVDKYFRRHS